MQTQAYTTHTFYDVNLFVMIMIIYALVFVSKRATGCLARQLFLTTGCVADDSVISFSSVAAVVVVFDTGNSSANVDVIESLKFFLVW